MESRAKLFGHPIHPMLVVFPLGLLVMACIFDAVALATGDDLFCRIAYWNIAAGVAWGPLAALFGFVDWFAIPQGTRAKSVGLWHGVGNLVLVGMFAGSWWLRYNSVGLAPNSVALALSFGGVLLGVFTAWLGGELVDRLGVGVDSGAHVDAPSSLSGLPASSNSDASAPPAFDSERRAA